MLDRPIITLTTDFGLKDPFVGIMKGIILGINPKAKIIDIAHNITPHNILEASHVISISYKYFPSTSIHVIVVDPEVGSPRRPLLIVTENHYFIGPDNGVLSLAFQHEGIGWARTVADLAITVKPLVGVDADYPMPVYLANS